MRYYYGRVAAFLSSPLKALQGTFYRCRDRPIMVARPGEIEACLQTSGLPDVLRDRSACFHVSGFC